MMSKSIIADIPPSVLGSIFFYLLVLAAGVAAWVGWLVWRGKRRARITGQPSGYRAKLAQTGRGRRRKR